MRRKRPRTWYFHIQKILISNYERSAIECPIQLNFLKLQQSPIKLYQNYHQRYLPKFAPPPAITDLNRRLTSNSTFPTKILNLPFLPSFNLATPSTNLPQYLMHFWEGARAAVKFQAFVRLSCQLTQQNISSNSHPSMISLLLLLLVVNTSAMDHCLIHYHDENICLCCEPGFMITDAGNCAIHSIENCAIYDSFLTCVSCTPTFKLSDGICVKDFSGCIEYLMPQLCFECSFGTEFQASACQGTLNCIQEGTNQCTQCDLDYSLQDGICVDQSNGCEMQNEEYGVCTKCEEGYKMFGFNCVPEDKLIDKCTLYNRQHTCTTCQTYFKYSAQTNSCIQKTEEQYFINQLGLVQTITVINNNVEVFGGDGNDPPQTILMGCITVNSTDNTKCAACDPHFTLNNGLCIDSYCAEYSDEGDCSLCDEGFQLNQTLAVCADQYCEEVADGICQVCSKGYFKHPSQPYCLQITQQNCVEYISALCLDCPLSTYFPTPTGCRKLQFGCLLYDFDSGNCQVCQGGLQLVNNMCLNINCAGEIEKCTTCKQGYTLNNDGVCVDPNCETYEDHLCKECKAGSSLNSDNKCVQIIPNCAQVNAEGVCAICAANYVLFNGVCESLTQNIENCIRQDNNQNCIVCEDRYYPSTDKKSCIRVSYLCSQYSPQTGFCFNCSGSITIRNGRCIDPNCRLSSSQGCRNCAVGFTVNAQTNICEQDIQNCIEKFNGKCTQCQDGFYLNAEEICVQLPAGCQFANYLTGDCLQCHEQFSLSAGRCIVIPKIDNCQTISSSNSSRCSGCESDFYITQEGLCKKVSIFCATGLYDPSNGRCLDCVGGYTLNVSTGVCMIPNCLRQNEQQCQECVESFAVNSNGECSFTDPNCEQLGALECLKCRSGYYKEGINCYQLPENCLSALEKGNRCQQCATGYTLNSAFACQRLAFIEIPNCRVYSGNSCNQCQNRYFLRNNRCEAVSRACLDYNVTTGACRSCIAGFNLDQGQCGKPPTQTDINCKSYIDGVCQECSTRYYTNQDRICVPVNPLCKEYDKSTGACTSCYPSYSIYDGKCILGVTEDTRCKQFNDNMLCRICFSGYYPQGGRCTRVNPLCKTYNETNGYCLSCYPGYIPSGRTCTIYFRDPNCKQFGDNDECVECVQRHYLKDDRCHPVNPLCKGFEPATGFCTSCYPGYAVLDGFCQLSDDLDLHPNCKKVQNETCVECYNRYFTKDGSCVEVNPLCKDYNQNNGACLSCYPGYKVEDDLCILPSPEEVDGNCKNVSTTNSSLCLQCYQGYNIINGRCQVRDDLCASYSQSESRCIACYTGYALNAQNKCIISSDDANAVGAADIYCIKWDGVDCLECADGFYLNFIKKCTQANPQCRTITSTGLCSSCYPGFVLENGDCLDPRSSSISIPYCESYDAIGRCILCMDRYFVDDGKCSPVSILCGRYDMNSGDCLSCNSPYFNLQQGKCIQLISIVEGCSVYQGPFCKQCEVGYYFFSYSCIRVDRNCLQFDYQRRECKSCSGGRVPRGAICS